MNDPAGLRPGTNAALWVWVLLSFALVTLSFSSRGIDSPPPLVPGGEKIPELTPPTNPFVATGGIRSVAVSPDGRLLASGGRDGNTLRVWDASTGRELRRLEGHSAGVLSVAFSPNGQWLASASTDKTLRLWDASTGLELRRLEGHSAGVLSVAFSPNGQWLASASDDKTLRLWDASTGLELRRLEGHSDSVWSVAFSPNGQWLASASDDKTLRLWDASTGLELRRLGGHSDSVRSVAFSPNGQWLASASDDATVRLWDVSTGRELRRLEGYWARALSVAFSPNGQWLASANQDNTLRLWDASTGRELRRLEGHSSWVTSVAFSPNGQWLASASQDKTLRLWDASTGLELRRLEGHSASVLSVAFSPNGQWLASASQDNTLRLWDASTGRGLRQLDGHSDSVWSVAFSPNGQWLASASPDKTLRLWDASTGSELRRLEGHSNSVWSVAFSPNGQWLASASQDNTLRLWDASTGRELRRLEGHSNSVWSVAFSPNGQWLASASQDNTLRLWDASTGRELRRLGGHSDLVRSVAFSPNGQWLASANQDNTLRLWDGSTGRELRRLEGHSASVLSLAFSPNGQWLASASDDKTLRLWDASTGLELRRLEGHSASVLSVAFSPNGQWLASASADNTVRLWNAERGDWIRTLVAGRDGAWLSLGSDGTVLRSEDGSLLRLPNENGVLESIPPNVPPESLGTLALLHQPTTVDWTCGESNHLSVVVSNRGPGRVFWIQLEHDLERVAGSETNSLVFGRPEAPVRFLEPSETADLRFFLSGLPQSVNPVSRTERVFLRVVTAHDKTLGTGPLPCEPMVATLKVPSLTWGKATLRTTESAAQSLDVALTNSGGARLPADCEFDLFEGTNRIARALGAPTEPGKILNLAFAIPSDIRLSETNHIQITGKTPTWPVHTWEFPDQPIALFQPSATSFGLLGTLLLATLAAVVLAWLFLNPVVLELSKHPASLLESSITQLPGIQTRLARAGRLRDVLDRAGVQPEWFQSAHHFVSEPSPASRCDGLLQRLGWNHQAIPSESLPVFEAIVGNDFPLNIVNLRFAFPTQSLAPSEILSRLRQAPSAGASFVVVVTTEERQQSGLLKEPVGAGGFWIVPDNRDLTQLHLAPAPMQVLAQLIARQIRVARVSPYQTKGGVERAVAFFGREQLLAHVAGRDPANYFLVGARQSGKSSLLKAILRSYQGHPQVECHHLALAGAEIWPRIASVLGQPEDASPTVLLSHLRTLERGHRRLFLIDEADAFVADQLVRGGETLGQFRSLSEEGRCFFVLTGFWRLYEAVAFDYQSPIKNFGETLEIGPLEESDCRQLATQPMASMNLRYESEALVGRILDQTGRRANLVAITCNDLLKHLAPGTRMIESRHVDAALASLEIETALAGWKLLVDDPEATRLDRVIVYLTVRKDTFTPADLTESLRTSGFSFPAEAVRRSLARLVLAFLLKKTDGRYTYPVPLFRNLVLSENPEASLENERRSLAPRSPMA